MYVCVCIGGFTFVTLGTTLFPELSKIRGNLPFRDILKSKNNS